MPMLVSTSLLLTFMATDGHGVKVDGARLAAKRDLQVDGWMGEWGWVGDATNHGVCGGEGEGGEGGG